MTCLQGVFLLNNNVRGAIVGDEVEQVGEFVDDGVGVGNFAEAVSSPYKGYARVAAGGCACRAAGRRRTARRRAAPS